LTIATDTRALRYAMPCSSRCGRALDGHDHVPRHGGLPRAGALRSTSIPQVVVADTERAWAIAAAVQRERTTKVLAITGSNARPRQDAGSRSSTRRGAYANPGNRNNEIGLPLAVLDAPDDARFAVYEMGAGKPGDIAYLTAIARPDVALVNNIAPAHLERMGSLLGIADTKAAIYDALPAEGVAVVNADDAFAPYFMERAHGRRIVRVSV
jgi:UDP-N-acetylmuramoyl-tripeptide--D-alanyl-D-alanine ligase